MLEILEYYLNGGEEVGDLDGGLDDLIAVSTVLYYVHELP